MVDDREFRCADIRERNRRLARWAGRRMGFSGAWMAAYEQEVATADYEAPGCEDVVRKIAADFAHHDIAIDAAEIRAQIRRLGG
ncbi:MAG: DUF1476 domain-containing protein [Tagaea sp. CACIAM 22H2]|jgi:hypothetical protein|nr:DUF1476 domain-containing protein [Tagaea sp. CACIAM 22H2]